MLNEKPRREGPNRTRNAAAADAAEAAERSAHASGRLSYNKLMSMPLRIRDQFKSLGRWGELGRRPEQGRRNALHPAAYTYVLVPPSLPPFPPLHPLPPLPPLSRLLPLPSISLLVAFISSRAFRPNHSPQSFLRGAPRLRD